MTKFYYFIIFFFCSFTLHAATYYVSITGDDTKSGLSNSLAFKTIQKAANTAMPGDIVYVNAGTYKEMVTFNNSGTAGSYISFEGIGNVVVEDPCPNSATCGVWTWGGIFQIENKAYIKIKGFALKNSWFFGIFIDRSNNIIIEGNSTYYTGASAIFSSNSSNIFVRNNVIQKACYHLSTTNPTNAQECISFSGVTNFEISGNDVNTSGAASQDYEISTGGEGIDAKDGSANGKIYNNKVHDLLKLGIYADSWSSLLHDIEIFSNTVYNCREGIVVNAENGGTTEKVRIFNNVCFNNAQTGISLMDYGPNPGFRNDILIVNNTVYHNGYGVWGGGIRIGTTKINNLIIRNNIISDNKYYQLWPDNVSNIICENNLIDGFRSLSGEIYGNAAVTGIPQFINASIDPALANFRLQSTSPAINKGTSASAPVVDYENTSRPQGAGIDIGAFEVNVSNPLRTPENPANTVSSLNYSYYKGSWSALPDFNTLSPAKQGTVSTFSLSPKDVSDNFAFKYTGYINVPADGQYTFYTSSDEGSKLYIGSTTVVNNDGLHGMVEKSGIIGLKAGKHAITVSYFEKTGTGENLIVSYSGPNIAKQVIPASVLYHVGGTTYTVDNSDPGFSTTGTWTVSTSSSQRYGINYLHDGDTQANNVDVAKWTSPITATARYDVYMIWAAQSDRPAAARVVVNYNGGVDSLIVNQRINGGIWNKIGTWSFTGGSGDYVLLRANDLGNTIADAVRWVPEGGAVGGLSVDQTTDGLSLADLKEESATGNGLLVYPNPTSGSVNLSFTAELNGQASVEFYNAIGQKVLSLTKALSAGTNNLKVDLSAIPATGVYYVKVSLDGKTMNQTVLINK